MWAARFLIALPTLSLALISVALTGLVIFTEDEANCGANPEMAPFYLALSALGQAVCMALYRQTLMPDKRFAPRYLAAPFALPLIYILWLIALAPRRNITVAA
jgi:hypothetical protein